MSRPNILLVTSDQQHWNTIGAFQPEIKTPNLDRLVREGTAFTRAYCPNPTCTPSRASIVTGLYPSQHGAWSLGTKLPEDTPTIGQYFTQAGYRTALVGKAHFQPLQSTPEFPSLEAYPTLQDLAFWKQFNGPFYGFEHVELARNHVNEAHVGQHYALWLEAQGAPHWREYFRKPTGSMDAKTEHKWPIPERLHQDAWIADRTCALLERYKQSGDHFVLWASFFDPHDPYLVPEPWDTMYDPDRLTVPAPAEGEHERNPPHFRLTQEANPDFEAYRETGKYLHGLHSHLRDREKVKKDWAVYFGMISLMDKYIGRILTRLDELGLADDTIVVFTTDHGDFCGHHGLRKKGPFHYEDLIKLPFLVRYPGHVPAGKTSGAMQSLVDLAPTFLSLCGLPVPRTMAGIDQSRVWRGEAERARDHIVCENRHEPTTVHLKTFVNERYKLTVYFNQSYGELFDLREDPRELRNLWHDPACAGLKSELLMKFLWAEFGNEPLWMPRIAGA